MREKLGLKELTAIGIGGMVGGGIFSVLGVAIEISGNAAFLAFFLGGLIAGATGYSYAKLSSRYRSDGGSFTYLEMAFENRHIGGIGGWVLFSGYIGTISLYAFTFGAYGAAMAGLAGDPLTHHFLSGGIVVLFVLLNLRGVREMGEAEDLIVAAKLIILTTFIAVGIFYVRPENMAPLLNRGVASVVVGSALIFVAYEGFELISNAVNEAENPRKDIPKAIFASVALVCVLYILIAYVALGNLTLQEIQRYQEYALAQAARPFFGEAGFLLIGLAALLSTASAINATIFGTSRLGYVLSKEKELPRAFSLKEKDDIPYVSVLVIGFLTLLLSNTGSLILIASFSSAVFLSVFLLVNLAALKLQKEINSNFPITAFGAVSCGGALAVLMLQLYKTQFYEFSFVLLTFTGIVILEYFFTAREG